MLSWGEFTDFILHPNWDDIRNYWVNDGDKVVFIILYWMANVAVFFERFFHYYLGDGSKWFPHLGFGVCFSRAAGSALKLNCAFLLLPVLRNVLSWARGTWLSNYINFDKNIVFHKHVAALTAFYTVVHIMGHFFNVLNISRMEGEALLLLKLNPLVDKAPGPWELLLTTPVGLTGVVASLCMIFMYTSAIEMIRRPYFEAFWYTHHLFVFFYISLALHGIGAILEPPSFWKWTIGPFVLYVLERTAREWRGSQDTVLLLAVAHPSKVLELQMAKETFKFKPGQYLFLNCPYISKHEWHPFTITAAPEEDFVSVHMRIVGDWTGKMWALLNPEGKLGVVQQNLLCAPNGESILRIDGPMGAASEEAFLFDNVMLIGAGIGVTPFASILKSVRYRLLGPHGHTLRGIKKVYFFWISRDKSAFEWFNDLLADLEQENTDDFLEINIYLTGVKKEEPKAGLMDNTEDAQCDPYTGLKSRTYVGRPDWGDIFTRISTLHSSSEVGVFFCGPKVLSKVLYQHSIQFTSTSKGGTRFIYHKENF